MKFPIHRVKAGVIGDKPMWVCSYSCYLHTHESLLHLVYQVITQYKNDNYLVG